MFRYFASGLTPTRVISSYRLLSSPVGVVTRQKGRTCWGLVLKSGGKTYYDQNGVKTLSDQNHAVLLPKGSVYEWTCVEPGECIVIDFDAQETGDVIRSVEISDPSHFLDVFSRLERLGRAEDTECFMESMLLLYSLLTFLSKSERKKYITKDKKHLLEPAVAYMLENYAEASIQNMQLAKLCDMSTVYFRKTFEAAYGTPPIRYLNRLRIEKAKAILSGDFDSITQVAESVGYSSVSPFSKMFQLSSGQSPTAFAKEIKR